MQIWKLLGLDLELKRSSLGMMAIFMITVIGLIGFSNHNAYATDFVITDAASCATLPNFYDFINYLGQDTCRIAVTPLILNSTDSLTIDGGITLENDNTIINNAGATITIVSNSTLRHGHINNFGTIENSGTLSVDSHVITNGHFINNYGTIIIGAEASLTNNSTGTINNYEGGFIDNGQNVNNYGSIHNIAGIITVADGGIINNNSGGSITNSYCDCSGGEIIINTGGAIDNYGTFSNGDLAVLTNNGTFTNFCGSTFTGTGSVVGNPIIDECAAHNTVLTLNPISNVPWGSHITISGSLNDTDALNVGVGSAIISFTGSNGTTIASVTTGGNGKFSIPDLAPGAPAKINWQVNASYTGNSTFLAATPVSQSYNTLKHPTSISSPTLNPASVPWGKTFTANSTLTDLTLSTPIVGATITFDGNGTTGIIIPITNFRGSVQPTITAPGIGHVGLGKVNATFAGTPSYLPSGPSTSIETITKHVTSLTVSPKSQFFAGNSFSAIGTLTDNVLSGIGVNGKTITFSGAGAFNLQNTVTNPITFTDASGMTTSSGFLNVHASTTIDTPSHPPAAVLTFKGVAAGTISIAVTFLGDNSPNPDIITQAVSAGDISLNLVYANGMTQIKILAFPGASPTIAIGSLQIQDSNLQTIQNIQFSSTPSPGNVLTVGSGGYSSVGKLGPASNSNQLNANFASDGNYIGSSATTTYSIYPQTAAGSGDTVTVLGDVNTGFLTQACTTGPAAGTDGDYICDNWKTQGILIGTYSGTPYYYKLPGVHAGEKDLYVEIDYMATHTPNPNSITDVVNAFKNSGVTNTFSPGNGINLHVTTDQQLTQVPALNVWKDNDYVNNNDFDSIKNANFGNTTEHPILTMSTAPTITQPVAGSPFSSTITVSGISVTTPTSKPTNGITSGKVVLSMNMTLGASATVTAGTVTKVLASESFPAAFKLGTPTQKVTTSTTNANIRVITLTIPFNSTSAVGPIDLGTFTIAETLSTNPSVSIVRNYGSPTIFTDLLAAKAQAYHYFLWAHSLGICGPSGQSEVQGNDGIVSLGCNFDTSAPEFTPITKDANGNYQTVGTQREQAGTFLHELGHNLGLNHGGPVLVGGTTTADSPINCKPNYPSVMSYSRELPGYLGSSWTPDFSHGTLNGLDETALKENTPTGLFNSGTAPTIVWNTLNKDISGNTFRTALASSPTLDWDGNNTPSATTVTGDVNNFGITGCTASYPETIASYPYKDYNDWANLNFNMRAGLLGNFDGVLGPVIHEAAHSDTDANVAQQIAIQSLKFQPITPPTSFELHWLTGVPLPLTFQLYQSDGKTPIITATGHAEYTKDGITFTRIAPDFKFTKTSLGNFYLTTWKTTTNQFPRETHLGINYVIDVPGANPNFKILFDSAHKVVIGTANKQVTLKIEFEK